MNRALREASLDVVYDGLCRFCERSLAAVQRIARRPMLRLHDANDHERIRTKFPMLADADIHHPHHRTGQPGLRPLPRHRRWPHRTQRLRCSDLGLQRPEQPGLDVHRRR